MKLNIYRIIFLSFIICLLSSIIGISKTAEAKGSIKLYYEGNAQVELISPRGTRVLIDVCSAAELSSPPNKKDILVTTHHHFDHYNIEFVKSFPGQQLCVKEGMIKLEGVVVRGIASAHNEGDKLKPEDGTNYIFIIDMAGLRIAHFGDIGQDALTSDQLSALGKVDIAIMQLSNPFSNMHAENRKAFNLMDQVKPGLIIPTHIFGALSAEIAAEKWDARISRRKFLSISADKLPDKTQIIFMDINANWIKLPESDL